MTAAETLRSRKLRATPVRLAVLEQLERAGAALSASELSGETKPDRITLYRTLLTLEKYGLVHRIEDGSGAPRYARCGEGCPPQEHHHQHPHLHCTTCDRTVCLMQVSVPKLPALEAFAPTAVAMLVEGTCERCQAN